MVRCPCLRALRPGAYALSLVLLSLAPSGMVCADTADPGALRVRFGLKDKEATDWSGKVEVSGGGKVESIRGVRWMPGDHAEGNTFVVNTRRRQAQGAGERQRVQRGERLPMSDNGIVLTVSGATPDTSITIDTKPGKATVKLADLRLGQRVPHLDGQMEVERVPAAAPLAETMADEDYPAAAVGKDGTLYVAYLSFTRGRDFQGARERPATPESGPNTGPLAAGEVRKIERPADFDYLAQPAGGEQIFLRTYRNGAWGEPVAVTDGKQELYRPAVAVDGAGKVWVFYSAHVDADANLDHGNWELLARSFDAGGKTGGAVVNVSNAEGGDFMPAACTDSAGRVWVTWVGGRAANFNVFVARQNGEGFGEPRRLSDSKANEWEPAIAASSNGHVAVAWDAYDKGDYDVYLATIAGRGTDTIYLKPQPVAASGAFEVRPSLAYDPSGQLWVAYEGSGDGWGKDFGALKKKGVGLYQSGRYVSVKVLKPDGSWHTPAADVMTSLPAPAGRPNRRALANAGDDGPGAMLRLQIAPSFPRLTTDPQGRVWLAFRGKPGQNWRVGVGSVWCEYVTRLDADGWSPAAWVPRSNNILDNRPALTRASGEHGDGAVMLVYAGDGRGEMNPPKVGDPHLRGGEDGDDKVEEALASEEAARLAGAEIEKAVQHARAGETAAAREAVQRANAAGQEVARLMRAEAEEAAQRARAAADAAVARAESEAANNTDDAPGSDKVDDGGDPAAQPAAAQEKADDAAPERGARRQNRQRAGNRRAGQADPNNDVFVAVLRPSDLATQVGNNASAGAPKLQPAPAEQPAQPWPDADTERKAIQAIRDYRVDLGTGKGGNFRIWRGEFHRHTELSPDGGNDGGLLDMWRYAIDTAGLDWIGDGDHDYGNGREYSWWTTQKAVTLFTLPGHFVPVYSYERSVRYPEGHRNCMFARRGIRSLPRLPKTEPDKEGPAPDTNMFYKYLHHFGGVCASHTSATDMGTDWRNHDPVVEPFVEIYQGDRNNYERPDSPRSAVTEAKLKQSTPEKESLGGWQPKGFVNLALLKGYRLAFQSSSDHISTHLSYCNVLIPAGQEPTRQAVIDAVKKRRVYGATDNIIADVRCKVGDTVHWMGEEFSTSQPPTLDVRLIGAGRKIAKVTIVKDDVVVHEFQPNTQDVKFTWTDPKPTAGKTSYYYVRGEQEPDVEGASSGELVWASPMWIKYEGK